MFSAPGGWPIPYLLLLVIAGGFAHQPKDPPTGTIARLSSSPISRDHGAGAAAEWQFSITETLLSHSPLLFLGFCCCSLEPLTAPSALVVIAYAKSSSALSAPSLKFGDMFVTPNSLSLPAIFQPVVNPKADSISLSRVREMRDAADFVWVFQPPVALCRQPISEWTILARP